MKLIDKNKMSEILNIEHVEEADIIDSNIVEYNPEQRFDELGEEQTDVDKLNSDVEEVRNNYHEIMRAGSEVLGMAKAMARATEGNPKAVESFAILMKHLADVNTQLIGVHEQKKKILDKKEKDNPTGGNTNINNAVFVGTMSELSKTNLVQSDKK